MPPKAKKPQSRAAPAASEPPSPRTPITPSRLQQPSAALLARHRGLLSAAAFSCTVAECDSSPKNGGGARVWLSEADMVAAALRPGAFVSISLVSTYEDGLHGPSLDSLVEVCCRCYSLDVNEELGRAAVGPGNYFVIASVFPSRKVSKNRVKLSWGASSMMGLPAVGREVFLCPLSAHPYPFSRKCKSIYLSLVPRKETNFSNVLSESSPVSTVKATKVLASPKTPSSAQSFSAEPVNHVPSADNLFCLDTVVALSALADEKITELLQICSARWLHGQHLLKGNFVAIPLCGKFCIFVIGGAKNSNFEDMMPEISNELPHKFKASDVLDDNPSAFLMDGTAKVHLSDSSYFADLDSVNTGLSGETTVHSDALHVDHGSATRLGGLSQEVEELKEIISSALADDYALSSFTSMRVRLYKGVLLYGPPGTGKTSLACHCARDAGASLFTVNGPEIISQYYGESEQALSDIFLSARRAAPAVVFIDELDAIAPACVDGTEELSRRMVASLSNLMDDVSHNERVIVIAATNRPDSIDPALRGAGRFGREIEIGVPSPDQRMDILQTLLSSVHHSLTREEIQSLASSTHGFVGADLAALCNEAALTSLKRYISSTGRSSLETMNCAANMHRSCDQENGQFVDEVGYLSSSFAKLIMSPDDVPLANFANGATSFPPHISCEIDNLKLIVTFEDFENAMLKVRPSAMREVMLELPNVRWEDVGGQVTIKKQLIEAVQWPQKCPEAFERIGIRPPRGLLMIGPPGCSKTLLARAVASEAKVNFLAVKGPELFSKWVGESEKAVKSLFAKARRNAPAIIFFDELDGLAVARSDENDGVSTAERVISQLLVEMDGLEQRVGVTVIAATNRPDKIDQALLRPGRFDRLLDVLPPNKADRQAIFQIHMRNMPCNADINIEHLANVTDGYTGADIMLVCREAALAALEESFDILEVSMRHFESAISLVQPTDVQYYQELALQFRRHVEDAT